MCDLAFAPRPCSTEILCTHSSFLIDQGWKEKAGEEAGKKNYPSASATTGAKSVDTFFLPILLFLRSSLPFPLSLSSLAFLLLVRCFIPYVTSAHFRFRTRWVDHRPVLPDERSLRLDITFPNTLCFSRSLLSSLPFPLSGVSLRFVSPLESIATIPCPVNRSSNTNHRFCLSVESRFCGANAEKVGAKEFAGAKALTRDALRFCKMCCKISFPRQFEIQNNTKLSAAISQIVREL